MAKPVHWYIAHDTENGISFFKNNVGLYTKPSTSTHGNTF